MCMYWIFIGFVYYGMFEVVVWDLLILNYKIPFLIYKIPF